MSKKILQIYRNIKKQTNLCHLGWYQKVNFRGLAHGLLVFCRTSSSSIATTTRRARYDKSTGNRSHDQSPTVTAVVPSTQIGSRLLFTCRSNRWAQRLRRAAKTRDRVKKIPFMHACYNQQRRGCHCINIRTTTNTFYTKSSIQSVNNSINLCRK